jgi:hypothetical protein
VCKFRRLLPPPLANKLHCNLWQHSQQKTSPLHRDFNSTYTRALIPHNLGQGWPAGVRTRRGGVQAKDIKAACARTRKIPRPASRGILKNNYKIIIKNNNCAQARKMPRPASRGILHKNIALAHARYLVLPPGVQVKNRSNS